MTCGGDGGGDDDDDDGGGGAEGDGAGSTSRSPKNPPLAPPLPAGRAARGSKAAGRRASGAAARGRSEPRGTRERAHGCRSPGRDGGDGGGE